MTADGGWRTPPLFPLGNFNGERRAPLMTFPSSDGFSDVTSISLAWFISGWRTGRPVPPAELLRFLGKHHEVLRTLRPELLHRDPPEPPHIPEARFAQEHAQLSLK